MLSINTNMPSLICQNNLTKSTDSLNKTIERLSTGFKINHAEDNAANYSISTNMSTKIYAYEIAEENTNMGADMISTASDSLSELQQHAERLMALATQARNGTYDKDSLAAIQAEADARLAEVERLYQSTEYNDIKLLDKVTPVLKEKGLDTVAENAGLSSDITASKGTNGKFIDDIVEETPDIVVSNPDELASAISSKSKIGISNAETLAKLAELVNSGTTCENKTIILTEDIDLSAYQSGTGWTPIGTNEGYAFWGTFNGNGHVVSNLYINNLTGDNQGLFGCVFGGLKNVGIENCVVIGRGRVGSLIGYAYCPITNCYAIGDVTGTGNTVGGLAGGAECTITNSHTIGNVSGMSYVGGLTGSIYNSNVSNNYATCNVIGAGSYVGGLVGEAGAIKITNSYATSDVTGAGSYVGGLAGFITASNSTISYSYAAGNVTGTGNCTGGLAGETYGTITNSYATGDVTGTLHVGGLAGYSNGSATNCYATGNANGNINIGGLIGYCAESITNSYSTGNAIGTGANVGGLVGNIDSDITNSASFANKVSGGGNVGSFVGNARGDIEDCNCTKIDSLNKIGVGGSSEDEKAISLLDLSTTFQVGINSDDSSQIETDTTFSYSLISKLKSCVKNGIETDSAFNAIDGFVKGLSSKSTDLGAVSNRLDSALESISVSYDNLVSSRSTLRDADVAEESSKYVQMQILQQASATLLATANQNPQIALTLLKAI